MSYNITLIYRLGSRYDTLDSSEVKIDLGEGQPFADAVNSDVRGVLEDLINKIRTQVAANKVAEAASKRS
jgi:hypothetical protein